MLKLHEMIRVLHEVALLLVFFLFHDRDWQGGVFKVMKIDRFLVFLPLRVISPKFLCR